MLSRTTVLLAMTGTAALFARPLVHSPIVSASNQAFYHVQATWSPVGPTPHFAGVDPRLHKLFVSNLAHGTVTVLNTQTGKIIGTIPLGGTVHTVMVDQQTQTVYVTDIQRGLLDVINARTDRVEQEIPVGGHPHGLAVSQRLHEALVSNISLNAVEVVNLHTNKVTRTIPVGPNPWGVTVNPRTDTIYAANTGINPFASRPYQQVNSHGDSVTVINGKTFQVVTTVPVGPHPWNIVANVANDQVYTGVSGANEVAVLQQNRVTKDIPVGQSPHGIALDGPLHRLLVNDSLSNQVSIIDTQQNRLVQTLPTGRQPQGITVNERTGTAFAVNQASQSVTVLGLNPMRGQHAIHALLATEGHLVRQWARMTQQILNTIAHSHPVDTAPS